MQPIPSIEITFEKINGNSDLSFSDVLWNCRSASPLYLVMLSLWRRWLMPTSGSRTRSNHTSQRSTKSGIYSSQSHRKHPKTRKNWIRLVVIFIILVSQIAELVLTRYMWLQVSYNVRFRFDEISAQLTDECQVSSVIRFFAIQSTTSITDFLVVDKSSVILVKRPKIR